MKEGQKIRGFFRVQLTKEENGTEKIVGDSGWRENQVTNLGIQDYIVDNLVGAAGGKSVTHMALGTGGAPASNATSLAGEITHAAGSRKAVS
ncbi:MAG: hypothetical protein WDA09_03745, partial [Bacteriovoracaceae bacterium]